MWLVSLNVIPTPSPACNPIPRELNASFARERDTEFMGAEILNNRFAVSKFFPNICLKKILCLCFIWRMFKLLGSSNTINVLNFEPYVNIMESMPFISIRTFGWAICLQPSSMNFYSFLMFSLSLIAIAQVSNGI